MDAGWLAGGNGKKNIPTRSFRSVLSCRPFAIVKCDSGWRAWHEEKSFYGIALFYSGAFS